jgi:Putative zinc-finger
VTRAKHLTDDGLLLLAGQRLSAEDRRQVEQHLEECASCRERHDNLKFAHSVFERLAEVGFSEVMGAYPQSHSPRRGGEFAFPWGPMTAIVLGCVCLLVVLFYPKTVPQASATELLANAVRSESQSGLPTAFRLQVGGVACAAGNKAEQLVSFQRSVRCSRALQRMKETEWGYGNPLSAKTYAAWHDSLHERHDSVAKMEAVWQVRTSTEEGQVHTASLKLRASDFHTTELTVQFGDEEEVTISEAAEHLPTTPVKDIGKVRAPHAQVKYVDEPGDLLEVQAWQLLHDLGADTGWSGVVVREGSQVTVKAVIVFGEQKKQLLKGFAPYPAIRLDIHQVPEPRDYDDILPRRTLLGRDAPAAAEPWLESKFPNSDARNLYANSEDRFALGILGRAFFIDKLRQRGAALAHCSCAGALAGLVAKENMMLTRQQVELSSFLQPLIGSPLRSPNRPLNFQQAGDLDFALQGLLKLPVDDGSSSLDARIEQVRHLL